MTHEYRYIVIPFYQFHVHTCIIICSIYIIYVLPMCICAYLMCIYIYTIHIHDIWRTWATALLKLNASSMPVRPPAHPPEPWDKIWMPRCAKMLQRLAWDTEDAEDHLITEIEDEDTESIFFIFLSIWSKAFPQKCKCGAWHCFRHRHLLIAFMYDRSRIWLKATCRF